MFDIIPSTFAGKNLPKQIGRQYEITNRLQFITGVIYEQTPIESPFGELLPLPTVTIEFSNGEDEVWEWLKANQNYDGWINANEPFRRQKTQQDLWPAKLTINPDITFAASKLPTQINRHYYMLGELGNVVATVFEQPNEISTVQLEFGDNTCDVWEWKRINRVLDVDRRLAGVAPITMNWVLTEENVPLDDDEEAASKCPSLERAPCLRNGVRLI